MVGLSRWVGIERAASATAFLVRRKTSTVIVSTSHGSFLAEKDESGALLCPVCQARFYSVRDLVWHLSYHAKTRKGGGRDGRGL